jgi:hypothetical protein
MILSLEAWMRAIATASRAGDAMVGVCQSNKPVWAQIDFASGMTVIFGETDSGKPGLGRVLKHAAGVRTAEEILRSDGDFH